MVEFARLNQISMEQDCSREIHLKSFGHRNYIEKSTWKQREFFNQRNYIEESRWKQRQLFEQQNCIEKST